MHDYHPLDLAPYCNVGAAFFGSDLKPPIGRQTLHGLPFVIGSDPACCFIGVGSHEATQSEGVVVPMGATTRWVIFAHALLESNVLAGDPIGRVVAHYLFRYADGEPLSVPIRERLEVSMVPTEWGQLPFLAVPDEHDHLLPRYEGRWEQAGLRLTEAAQGLARAYYLWAWANPQPERVLQSVTIEPAGRKFLVAAITLGHLAEAPLGRNARREVQITLPQPADAARPFNLEVEVDRGAATYPYPLPGQGAADFLGDALKGWGQAAATDSSPAYVAVTARPSATITIKNDGQEIGRANWGQLQAQGQIETPRLRLEVVDRGRNWVHVSVLDDETGKPIPCRIHFRSPEGIPYQPHGHHDHVYSNLDSWHMDVGGDVRLGQITYAYIDGRCQGWLPRGEVLVDIARGFEYEPLRTRLHIEPGQRELTLRLKRWTDMNARRWFSGDTHVHFLGALGAQCEAMGEDLNVVNLLQSQWGHLFTNGEDFVGRPLTSDDGRTIVYCSQENRQHFLGHLSLLGLKTPIMPWGSDGPGEAELGGTLEATLSDWADQCHAQGGTVVIPHLPNPNCEPAVLIATGRADAVEMLVHGEYQHVEYYRYLNAGYRLPLVGGTDKMTSEVPVGLYRTYALLTDDQPFTYDNWCQAVRAGRTFLSGGPLLDFTVDGAHPGSTLRLPEGGGTVEVEVTANSIFPIHALQIVQQGRVVASTEEAAGARSLQLKTTLRVTRHTWLAARCGGPNYTVLRHHDTMFNWRRGIFAHTSPIYIAAGGDWWLHDNAVNQYMLALIEGGLDYIRHTAARYPPGTVTHHHGEADHLAYLERPFHEAQAAVLERMRHGGGHVHGHKQA
jgi:hypothetical protein